MKVAMSAALIVLVLLTVAFLPATAAAQGNQPVSIVPNIGNLATFEDSVLFSPNGQVLAIPEGGWRTNGLTLWDLSSGRPLRGLQYFAFFQVVSFMPDGKLIATGHKDGKVNFWDVATGGIVGAVQVGTAATPGDDPSAIRTLWIDDKGQVMVAGDTEGLITVWTIAGRKQVNRFKLAPEDKSGSYPEIVTARLSADGSKLIATINGRTTDGNFVRVFDTRTKKEVTSFKLPKQYSFTSTGVIGDDEFVVRFSDSNCKIDELFYFSLKDTKNFASVYKPTKCDKRAKDNEPDAPRIFSSSGQSRVIVAQNDDPEIRVWDRRTRRLERTVRWPADASAHVIAFSRDLQSGISRVGDRLQVYQFDTGELVKELASYGYPAENAIASKDGRGILISHEQDPQATEKDLESWRVDELNVKRLKLTASKDIRIYDYASHAMIAVGANEKNEIFIYSTETGKELRRVVVPGVKTVSKVVLSSNGKFILLIGEGPETAAGREDGTALAALIGVEGGKARVVLKGNGRSGDYNTDPTAIAFSVSSASFAVGRRNGTAEIWNTEKGTRVKSLPANTKGVIHDTWSLAFSNDDQSLIGSSLFDEDVFIWNIATGRFVRSFEMDPGGAHYHHASSLAVSHDGKLVAGGLAQRASSSGDIGAERGGIKVWDTATGKLRFSLRGHQGAVFALTFSPDDRFIVSGSLDGTIRYWDRATGNWLATFTGSKDGRWIIVTESGFFAGSIGSDDLINAVRGLDAYSVSQFRDHLYRPDLVTQFLKGDPERRYRDAAQKLNLAKILDSGPAPQIELLPERKVERAGDTVRVTVRVNSTGGGIGPKVVWRVNGVTAGTADNVAPDQPGSAFRIVTETLKVDPSQKSTIEVTAYNGSGLLASEAFRLSIDSSGVTDAPRPRMFVIAVGVSNYAMADWKLQFAAKDAQSFAEAIKAAASGLYDEVRVRIVPELQATRAGIGAAFNEIKGMVKASDVFVLFVAGHGRTVESTGTYYFLPRDLTFDGGHSVEDGIGQDTWQAWLKQIPAQKSILVFDTCESSAAAGLTRGGIERETAIDRLRYATGRSVITAARQAAYEGYQGHGVLTYAILDALTEKEAGRSHEVDLYQLAAQVDRKVPEISYSLFGVYQRPHNKIEGNFPIGMTRPAVAETEAVISSQPTHVVIRSERVRTLAATNAPGERILMQGSQVRVVEFDGDWAVVARDGQKMGYLPVDALLKLQ